jgi:hypothetical protein
MRGKLALIFVTSLEKKQTVLVISLTYVTSPRTEFSLESSISLRLANAEDDPVHYSSLMHYVITVVPRG